MRCAAVDTTYVIDHPQGPVWSYPAGEERDHNYGEADAKCAEAALKLAYRFPTGTVCLVQWLLVPKH